MRFLCLLLYFLSVSGTLSAQQWQPKTWLSIETNTSPLIFGGYAIGLTIQPRPLQHWSILIGQAGHVDFPAWVVTIFRPQNKDTGLDWRVQRARVLSIDYFLSEKRRGWYFGQFNFFFNNQIQNDNQVIELTTHIPMLRLGYRWFPFDFGYLYLSPWMGLGTEYRLSGESQIVEAEWATTKLHYFLSVNAGIRF
ncbi:MAG: hypothetical protein AAGD05_06260 [Bacteroidota bacterium]